MSIQSSNVRMQIFIKTIIGIPYTSSCNFFKRNQSPKDVVQNGVLQDKYWQLSLCEAAFLKFKLN